MTTVILAEVEHPGNVGSVARVMANFGLTDLVLINPQCDHLSQDSRNLAVHAQNILEDARVADWDALDAFPILVATTGVTASEQNLLRTTLTPRAAAAKVAGGKGLAILFGRESNGLTNEELSRADMLVTIPTHKRYESMNLSHAVAIMLYELATATPRKRFTSIPQAEQHVLLSKIEDCISALPFKTEGQRETQRKLWRNIVGRSLLSRHEGQAAMGYFEATRRLGTQPPTAATARTRAPPRSRR